MSGSLAGTGILTRFALRRDKIMLPVWVYIVMMNPSGSTYSQKKKPPVRPPWKPVLLIRSPKTKLRLWWWAGTKITSPMITSTPST